MKISLPAVRFHQDNADTIGFIHFVLVNTNVLEATLKHLTDNLLSAPGLGSEAADMIRQARTYNAGRLMGPSHQLQNYLPIRLEMIFCRLIDNFLNYISEVFALALSTTPEMLKSELVSVETVMAYSDRTELIEYLVERKVMSLSMKSMSKLANALKQKHGFVMFETAEDCETAAELIEKRNLVTHNRGLINNHYLTHIRSATKPAVGDKLTFTANEVFGAVAALNKVVTFIEQTAFAKIGISQDWYGPPWPSSLPEGDRDTDSTSIAPA